MCSRLACDIGTAAARKPREKNQRRENSSANTSEGLEMIYPLGN